MQLDTETEIIQTFCYIGEEREINVIFFSVLSIFEIKNWVNDLIDQIAFFIVPWRNYHKLNKM